MMNSLTQDFRYALRKLTSNPGFATVAVVTIALGIGVTTAMFSVVSAVLLRPLPFHHPDRLVAIGVYDTRHGLPKSTTDAVSYPDIADVRARNRSFADIAVYDSREATLTGQGEPRHVSIVQVNAGLFALLGIQPYVGRTFFTGEDQPGRYSAIISYRFWRTYFNSNKSVVGRNINLNGRSYALVGVMPQGFQFPIASQAIDFWTTLAHAQEVDSPGDVPVTAQRGNHSFGAIARLRDGVTLQQANADLTSIGRALAHEYPNTNAHNGMVAVPELESLVGDVRRPLLVLLAAVSLVLLIACANVASLLLVRGNNRSGEIGVRAALGATRLRLVRQMVTESVVLSTAGSALGVVLASWMLSGVLRLYPENLPRADQVGIDLRVLLFGAGLAITTGLLFGLMPALKIAPSALGTGMRSGGRTATSSRGHNRLRSGLVIAETAMGVMLLIGAGLLLRSLYRLANVDLGFNPNHLITASFDLSETRYNAGQQDRFIHNLLSRLNALPGVEAASGALPLPLSDNNINIAFNLLDHPVPNANWPSENLHLVAPAFFEAMRMPLVRGRFFDERDQRNSKPVMIVSAAFARKYFPNEDPIGKRIEIGGGEGPARAKYKTREVVGVVGDLRTENLAKEPAPTYYVPLSQLMWGPPTVIVRTTGISRTLAPEISKALHEMDSEAPLYQVRSMEDYLALALGRARFQALLLVLFAGIALLLTAVGLYGVMAQSVAQRTQEIGIRMAMGATRENVRTMILQRGTFLSIAGTAIGIVGSLAFARLIESLLYEIPPRDPLTYISVCLILGFVAVVASYVPAARATRLDPMEALRFE